MWFKINKDIDVFAFRSIVWTLFKTRQYSTVQALKK
jgi:hypothetical protein